MLKKFEQVGSEERWHMFVWKNVGGACRKYVV